MVVSREMIRIALIVLAVAAVVLFFSIKGCRDRGQEAAQARHETKQAEAYAGAAKGAVSTVVARSNEEMELREVVAEAAEEIANAEGSDEAIPAGARNAALRAACRLPAYRDEPACALLRADPRRLERGR